MHEAMCSGHTIKANGRDVVPSRLAFCMQPLAIYGCLIRLLFECGACGTSYRSLDAGSWRTKGMHAVCSPVGFQVKSSQRLL